MILLQNLFDLLEFCAENNTYIQHTPGATGSQNRFSRFPIESATEQQSNLGFPRMEVVQLPFGIINDYDSAQRDDMSVRVRVIIKLSDKYDYAEQVTAMDNAKRALMEMVNYILTAQEGYTNENCLICAFDVNSAKYQFIDRLTYGGNAVGCELSIDFKQYIDWDNIVYGDLPGYQTFCDKVDACLDIPTEDGEYVLTITNGVKTWTEFSPSGLTDGNGTVINGTKVYLGGSLLQDTTTEADGFDFILEDTPANIKVGIYDNPTSLNKAWNVEHSDNGYNFLLSNKFENIPVNVIDADGLAMAAYNDNDNEGAFSGVMKNTANGNLFDFALWLNSSGTDGYTRTLDKDGFSVSGSNNYRLFNVSNDGVTRYNNGNAVNQFDNSGFMYIGSSTVDGSWRFATSSGNLVIQKRESGNWVTKQTLI